MDVATRWNSTYLMIESYIKNKITLKSLTETNILNANEWNKLEQIKKRLEPFYEITKLISGSSYPTLGFCYSLILELRKIIANFETDNDLKHLFAYMKDKFNKYFGEINDTFLISVILDPRIKDKKFPEEDKGKYLQIFKNTSQSYKTSKKIPEKDEDLYDRLFPKNEDLHDTEINTYLSMPLSGPKTNILKFWKDNESYFPILSKMARNYLCIPATSVSCEAMFSKAGDTITKKRNRLSPKLIREIMCLQSWIFNYDELTTK
jgi:hypothetical protein